MQHGELSLFVYGSMCNGWPQYEKIKDYVVSSEDAFVRATAYRLPVGYPVLVAKEGLERHRIPGMVVKINAPELLFRLLDEFHGFMPMTSEKSLFIKESMAVELGGGGTIDAIVYLMNPLKMPKNSTLIPQGDWISDLKSNPAVTSNLSERQTDYVQRLARAKGREIVPIDLSLYRELMKLDLIVDKGRRLALTRLGKEVARYLDNGPILS